MSLEPMYFGESNRTIIQANIGNPFQLPPTPFPISLLKKRQNANATILSNRFNLRDRSDNFKVPREVLDRSA